ncbi:hypothetical protein IAR50_007072 [Cryptococcus sp. DSM 104548]
MFNNTLDHLRVMVATLFATTPHLSAQGESAMTEPASHASGSGVSSERSVQAVPAGSVSASAFVPSDDGIDVAVNHVFRANNALTTTTHWVEGDYMMTVRKTTLLDEPTATPITCHSAHPSSSSSSSAALGQGRAIGDIDVSSVTSVNADRQVHSGPSSGPAPRHRQLDLMNTTHAPYPGGASRVQIIARHREQLKVAAGSVQIAPGNGPKVTRAINKGPKVSVAALCDTLSGTSSSSFAPASAGFAPGVHPTKSIMRKRSIDEVQPTDAEPTMPRILKRPRTTSPGQLTASAHRPALSSSPTSDVILTPPLQAAPVLTEAAHSPRGTKRTGDEVVDDDANAQDESAPKTSRVIKRLRFDPIPATVGHVDNSRPDAPSAFVPPPRAFLAGAPPSSPLPCNAMLPEESLLAQGAAAALPPIFPHEALSDLRASFAAPIAHTIPSTAPAEVPVQRILQAAQHPTPALFRFGAPLPASQAHLAAFRFSYSA